MIWRIEYDGLWLGGFAFVMAETAEQALTCLKAAKPRGWSDERWAKDMEYTTITADTPQSGVIYNHDGDY